VVERSLLFLHRLLFYRLTQAFVTGALSLWAMWRQWHAVRMSTIGRKPKGRFGKETGLAAFSRYNRLGDMNRLNLKRSRFGVVELGVKCKVAHLLGFRRQIDEHLPMAVHPAINSLVPRGRV